MKGGRAKGEAKAAEWVGRDGVCCLMQQKASLYLSHQSLREQSPRSLALGQYPLAVKSKVHVRCMHARQLQQADPLGPEPEQLRSRRRARRPMGIGTRNEPSSDAADSARSLHRARAQLFGS